MYKKGFTIIELLTACTVIIILMSILLPVLQTCRAYSRSFICSSRIKQLTFCLLSYNSEHRSLPQGFDSQIEEPPPKGYLGNGMLDRRGWWWLNFIEKNNSTTDFKRQEFLYCPDNKISTSRLYSTVLHGNYGVNQSICKKASKNNHSEFTGQSLKLSQITSPSSALLLTDSGYALINWHNVTRTPPQPLRNNIQDKAYIPGLKLNNDKNLLEAQKPDALTSRHPNKTGNIGFADGHTERLKAEKLKVTKKSEGYVNRVPLWSQQKTN